MNANLIASEYQDALIYASLEYITASQIFGSIDRNSECWAELCMDFIFRNLTVGIIYPVNINSVIENTNSLTPQEICSLYKIDRASVYFEKNLTTWDLILYAGTDALDALLDEFGLRGWDFYNGKINLNFINKLDDIYDKFGFSRLSHLSRPADCPVPPSQ